MNIEKIAACVHNDNFFSNKNILTKSFAEAHTTGSKPKMPENSTMSQYQQNLF